MPPLHVEDGQLCGGVPPSLADQVDAGPDDTVPCLDVNLDQFVGDRTLTHADVAVSANDPRIAYRADYDSLFFPVNYENMWQSFADGSSETPLSTPMSAFVDRHFVEHDIEQQLDDSLDGNLPSPLVRDGNSHATWTAIGNQGHLGPRAGSTRLKRERLVATEHEVHVRRDVERPEAKTAARRA